jgi:hypothetical protein
LIEACMILLLWGRLLESEQTAQMICLDRNINLYSAAIQLNCCQCSNINSSTGWIQMISWDQISMEYPLSHCSRKDRNMSSLSFLLYERSFCLLLQEDGWESNTWNICIKISATIPISGYAWIAWITIQMRWNSTPRLMRAQVSWGCCGANLSG